MNVAINFNNQTKLRTIKIYYITSDRVLATNFVTVNLSSTYKVPK